MTELEVTGSGDGLVGRWLHEPDAPWDDAPTWAKDALRYIHLLVADGRWAHPYPVTAPLTGHVVHCEGVWDGEEQVCPPQREAYYAATTRWSDGATSTLTLWHDEDEQERKEES